MSYRIIEQKAKKINACYGMGVYVSEITIDVDDGNVVKRLYVSVNSCGDVVYVLSEKSSYDWLINDACNKEFDGDINILEEYESSMRYESSKYAEAFRIAEQLIDNLKEYK